MPYDPDADPRYLGDEDVKDSGQQEEIDVLHSNLALLGKARDYVLQEGWAYVHGTAQAIIEDKVRLLSIGGPNANTLEQIHRLRGEIAGLRWVQGLPDQIGRELIRLEGEVARVEREATEVSGWDEEEH